ncbi:hypothetical protein SOV_24190 [Sporomusa ovata DSM 2662]|uniref:Uncharacterized protein n=1 Tax=Sporomusa ovata TaxID=2378 RepID=A0A0U1L459_9FIRM|nr:hypothetical protein [Sporomusa ovata]EQB25735.1 hypothetical protein SOV_4c03980 [Sporomusa ovata DSM 2662]CQR74295.1 hypothetical protein SpAn4DRAFT_0757 [Sporomusa ovata]
MKRRLLVAILSIAVLTMATTLVEAAKLSDQETNLAPVKADAKRVEKLRHGYITYDQNKMYYYW